MGNILTNENTRSNNLKFINGVRKIEKLVGEYPDEKGVKRKRVIYLVGEFHGSSGCHDSKVYTDTWHHKTYHKNNPLYPTDPYQIYDKLLMNNTEQQDETKKRFLDIFIEEDVKKEPYVISRKPSTKEEWDAFNKRGDQILSSKKVAHLNKIRYMLDRSIASNKTQNPYTNSRVHWFDPRHTDQISNKQSIWIRHYWSIFGENPFCETELINKVIEDINNNKVIVNGFTMTKRNLFNQLITFAKIITYIEMKGAVVYNENNLYNHFHKMVRYWFDGHPLMIKLLAENSAYDEKIFNDYINNFTFKSLINKKIDNNYNINELYGTYYNRVYTYYNKNNRCYRTFNIDDFKKLDNSSLEQIENDIKQNVNNFNLKFNHIFRTFLVIFYNLPPDLYLVSRLFKEYKPRVDDDTKQQINTNHPTCAQNIIVHAGMAHIEFYSGFLQSIGFKKELVSIPVSNHCIAVNNFDLENMFPPNTCPPQTILKGGSIKISYAAKLLVLITIIIIVVSVLIECVNNKTKYNIYNPFSPMIDLINNYFSKNEF